MFAQQGCHTINQVRLKAFGRTFTFCVISICLLALPPSDAATHQPVKTITFPKVDFPANPFWREKQKVFRKIRDDRAVIVLVKSNEQRDNRAGKYKLYMQGAGHIRSPKGFAFSVAQKFDQLPKVSSTVREAVYDEARQQLFLHTRALGYTAKMWMQVGLQESDKGSDIRFFIHRGVFAGMTGMVRFSEVNGKVTEVSLVADYNYNKLPVPEFFVRFGLEVVLQKVAGRMRSYIEENYRVAQTAAAK